MDRISKAFVQTRPFIGYLTGGDGGINYSVDCSLALIEGGVDILEIGLPFSDPVADGPVIQRAHERSLTQGAKASDLLEIGRQLRGRTNVPLVLFSYFNPIFQKGSSFLREAKAVGYDGLLIVDASISEQTNPFFDEVECAGLTPIVLATPSTSTERLQQISRRAKGFLYYVSQKGTTGVRTSLAEDFATQIHRLRQNITIPIAAGFGIAARNNAQEVLNHADGFIVGSAFVKKMEEKASPKELKQLAESIDPRGSHV